MSIYVDSSALLKRYVEEADSANADALLRADPALLTARHTVVEVRRNLARLLSGRDLVAARAAFAEDIRSFSIIELDQALCESAATVAETMGVRTLDALDLAAGQRISAPGVGFLTFDLRQAQAARALGLAVVTA
jgi:predicted nucleic acid-binding protein